MERVTQHPARQGQHGQRGESRQPAVVRVLRGAPDREQTAALMTVLLTALGAVTARDREVPEPARPTWRAFTGHSGGGWGRP